MTEELNVEASPIGPGTLLRQAREQKGLTTQQIAQRLNLRHTVVLGIESDDYEQGMSITYIRGYIRNYARLVDLNEQDLNRALSQIEVAEPAQEMNSFSERTRRDRSDSRWRLLTWIIVLALAGALGWWALSLQTSDEQSLNLPEPTNLAELDRQANPEPDPLTINSLTEAATLNEPSTIDNQLNPTEPSLEQPPITSYSDDANMVVADPVMTEVTVADISAAAEFDSPIVAEPSNSTSALPPTQALEITLQEDCWMLVQDVDGNKLVEGLKPKGFTTVLAGSAPYKLRLGAPEAVTLSYNGSVVDLSSFRAGKVARLTVPR